jgi:hypothetical protein
MARSVRRLEDVSLMVCCKDGAKRLFARITLEGRSASAKSTFEYRVVILTRKVTEGRERLDLREYNPWLSGHNGWAGWKIAHANVRSLSCEEVGRWREVNVYAKAGVAADWLHRVAGEALAQLAHVAGRASLRSNICRKQALFCRFFLFQTAIMRSNRRNWGLVAVDANS